MSSDVIALLLTGLLGVVTFRRLVNPIQALERAVKTVAAGDYAETIPFTRARDETVSFSSKGHSRRMIGTLSANAS